MNTIKQVRVTLEEVATVVNEFETQVIQEFDMKSNPSSEIQYRGIGIQYEHGENIRRSDDEIIADRTRILELEKQVSKLQKQKESLLKELDLLASKYRD